MPDPIGALLDPTMQMVLSPYAILFASERIAPGRSLARALAAQTGFWHGALSRVFDMFTGRDISRPE